jgi:hypothetical protein
MMFVLRVPEVKINLHSYDTYLVLWQYRILKLSTVSPDPSLEMDPLDERVRCDQGDEEHGNRA